jgi:hypothetical protein
LNVSNSSLPGASLFDGVAPDDWTGTLRLLAAALPDDGPAIIVLDEFPWLCASSPDLEGALQVAWDRVFERRPGVSRSGFAVDDLDHAYTPADLVAAWRTVS